MSKFLAFFIFLNCFHFAYSQEQRQFRYTKFGETYGLNCDFIYNATQDANGQLWFGTHNGLYTYDNKFFNKYSPEKYLKDRSFDNILYGLYYDHKTKLIWCSSIDAFVFFDPYKREFIVPDYSKSDISELADNQAFIFHRDKKGTMWLGTQKKGLAFFDDNTQKVHYIIQPKEGKYPMVFDIIESKEGIVYVSTSWGLFIVKNNQIAELLKPENFKLINDIEYDSTRNCLWIGSPGYGLYQFNIANHQFISFKHKTFHHGKFVNDGIFHSIKFLNSNELLLEGNILFNVHTNSFFEIKNEAIDYNFNASHVEKTIKDKEGNIWLCTYNGLYQLPVQNQHVRTLQVSNPNNDFGIEINQAITIKDKIYYWCSDFGGLMSYDLTKKRKENFSLNTGRNYTITSICNMQNDLVWMSTNMGVFEFNISNSKFSKIQLAMDDIDQNNIINLYIDKKNNIYATVAQNGLFVLRPQKEAKFIKVIDLKKDFPLYYVSAVSEDNNNLVWCVSPQGLFSINSENQKVKNYYGKVDSNAAKIETVNGLVCDKNDHIWFTDYNSGLSELFFDNQQLKLVNHTINGNIGIKTKRANGLIFDDQNNLWVASIDGLFAIDVEKKTLKAQIRKQQGLTINGLERTLALAQNTLIALDWSNFNLLDLKQFHFNKVKPALILSNIIIGKNKYSYLAKKEFSVAYNDGYISLSIGSTAYSNGNQNKYFYQMIGIDKLPIAMENNYQINYSGIAPGRYTLNIWTINSNGVSSDIQEIILNVKPPFYKTWWFILLAILILSGLIYFIYKQRINSIRKESKLKEDYSKKLAETEMKALRAQMNPHFMFNAMNSIQKYILKNEPQLASQYLTKFSRLIRVILEQSQKKSVSIEEEIELLMLYTDLEKMRFDNQFEFLISVDSNLSKETVQIPSMILQPFIENAIWHGLLHKVGSGIIKLSITKKNDSTICIEIEDNGIGRKKATELKSKNALKNKSYGMQITQDRLSLLNQYNATIKIIDLYDDNENGIGTIIELLLPLKNNKS